MADVDEKDILGSDSFHSRLSATRTFAAYNSTGITELDLRTVQMGFQVHILSALPTSFPNFRETFRKHAQLWITPTPGVGPWVVRWPLLFMKYYTSYTLTCYKSLTFDQHCNL